MSSKNKRERQRGRRALDYRAMMSLDGDVLTIRPYVDRGAAKAGRVATAEDGANGLVTVYDVTCMVPLPVSPNEARSGITTRFDVSGSEYPRTPPTVFVVNQTKPFSTHVHPESGIVCIGELWEELKGKELAAEFALRVIRAYNFQDPPANELGFQPGALFYFENVLNRGPFDPNLRLPAVPDNILEIPDTAPQRRHVVIVFGNTAPSVRPRLQIVGARPSRLVVVGRSAS